MSDGLPGALLGTLLGPVVLYLVLFFLTLHGVDRLANRPPPEDRAPEDAS